MFGVLGSPLAWGGHLVGNYSLEEWFACSESAKVQGEILGLGVHTVSVLLNTAMLTVAVASGLVAQACWRKPRGQDGDERMERAQWMAFAGIVQGALFGGIIPARLPASPDARCVRDDAVMLPRVFARVEAGDRRLR